MYVRTSLRTKWREKNNEISFFWNILKWWIRDFKYEDRADILIAGNGNNSIKYRFRIESVLVTKYTALNLRPSP